MSPVISVILPVYNSSKYLAESISSILNQTFRDFELIIINDGSKDNSLEIIKQFSDSRIILVDQENKGLLQSLIFGASICRGEFIARMDHDDISILNRFEKQLLYLRKHPEISVVSGAVNFIDEEGNSLGRSFPPTSINAINKYLLNYGCVITHPAVMIRRKDFDEVGGFSKGTSERFLDYHLWVKFIRKGFKVKNESRIVLNYRLLDASMTSQFYMDDDAVQILREVLKVDNPDPILLEKLNHACKKQNTIFKARIDKINNLENRIYRKIAFIGKNNAEKFISQLKNCYIYFK